MSKDSTGSLSGGSSADEVRSPGQRWRYRSTTVSGTFDPVGVAAVLAGSADLSDYIAYERDERVLLGADPIGSVTLDAHAVRSTLGGEFVREWTGNPWPLVSAALDRSPIDDWRAYGWVSFEARHAASAHPHEVLAHIMIPRVEFDIGAADIVIRTCGTSGELDSLVAALHNAASQCRAVEASQPATLPVDTAGIDTRYLSAVAEAVERIRAHRLQKVVLSRSVEVPFGVDMPATYITGRRANTPARSFLVDLGGWQFCGFSPETVLEVTQDGHAATQPLAGTCVRTGDPQADNARRSELLSDPKEVFEHAISVRHAVEELDTIGHPATTRVSEFLDVKARNSVQHLGSRVETRLKPSATSWDAFGVVFPAITATGLPKTAAYDTIDCLESAPRGPYGGAVVTADGRGGLDAALVLRAVYQRAGKAWLRAGAGVVSVSTPEREHEETCEKFRSIAPYLVADHTRPARSGPLAIENQPAQKGVTA